MNKKIKRKSSTLNYHRVSAILTMQKFCKLSFKIKLHLLRQKAKVTVAESKIGSRDKSQAISYRNISQGRMESCKKLRAIWSRKRGNYLQVSSTALILVHALVAGHC